jgi:hypothetical protein
MGAYNISDENWRCRIVRTMIAGSGQGSQSRFVVKIGSGLSVGRWNNFENSRPLSREVAILLVRKIPGLTLDWLLLGKEDGLPGRMRDELEAAANALQLAEGHKR